MDYTEAKKLFFEYGGLKFGMWHEGVIKKYESFNVPKKLERQWQQKILEEWREKMKLDHPPLKKWVIISNYFHRNREFSQKDSIEFLKENKDQMQDMDDLSKLIVIELIFDYSLPEKPKKRKTVIEKCVKRLYDMLEKEAKGEFVIDESYYEQGQIPDYLTDGKLKERLDCILCKFLDKKNGV